MFKGGGHPMETTVLEDHQKTVDLNNFILRSYGIDLSKDADILDFGCGSGRHTYEYLDAGYSRVVGFDVQDFAQLRDPADHRYFLCQGLDEEYRIPAADNSFDFVVSASVFEHVQNQAKAIAEIGRVLKPGGATLHSFPSRWRPIEPHIKVPFGGVLQTEFWLSIWAALGVRNEYQRELGAGETVANNLAYCADGIKYLDATTIRRLWQTTFADVHFVERAFLGGTRSMSSISRVAWPLAKTIPGFESLYRCFHNRAVLAINPKE